MDAIANWIWQGSAIAVAVTLCLGASRRISATTRYRLWWIALAAVLLLPFLPAFSSIPGTADGLALTGGPGSPVYSVPMPALPWWAARLLVPAWIAWATWSLLRTAHAVAAVHGAKQRAGAFPQDLEDRLTRWIDIRREGRPARLVVSSEVGAAAVLGLMSPAIAVSPAALRELNAGELEGILLHEWAHVQRRDDIARLVQLVVRAVAGLHPAVWWIDRQLHIDRETACDDWAINLTGSARAYAASLTKLAALSLAGRDRQLLPTALSASGPASCELTTRVQRLLDRGRSTSTRRPLAATALVIPVMMVLTTILGSVELIATVSPASPRAVPSAIFAAPQPDSAAAVAFEPSPAPGVSLPFARKTEGLPVTLQGTMRAGRTASPTRPPAAEWPLMPAQLVGAPADPPGDQTPVGKLAPTRPIGARGGEIDAASPPTPWGAAAGAGVSVGRGSQKAAVATAGFFTKLSKSIADVF